MGYNDGFLGELTPGAGLAQGFGSAAVPWYRAGGAPMPVAAYQPKGAASLAASYSNLANPGTYDAAPGVAPTWDETNGWKSGGTAWLDTGYVPTATTSVIIRFSSAGANFIFGATTGGNINSRLAIYPALVQYGFGGNTVNVAPALAAGVLAIAGVSGYRDGVLDTAAGNRAAMDVSMLIFKLPGYAPLCNAYVQALAIYDTTLTAPRVAAISSAMAAL